MKRLLALAILVVSSATQALAATASGDTLVFSRDDRPVDGALTQISLVETAGGLFTATLHRAWVDMTNGQPGEDTKVLGEALACQTKATVVHCYRDQRPADGQLVELTVTVGEQGLYTAVLRKAFVDMQTGQSHEQTVVLAEGLKRQLAF